MKYTKNLEIEAIRGHSTMYQPQCSHLIVEAEDGDLPADYDRSHDLLGAVESFAGMNCIKIGPPGKLILSERKGLFEVLFS